MPSAHNGQSRRIDGQRVVANRRRPDQVVSCAIRFNSLGKICVDVGDGNDRSGYSSSGLIGNLAG